MDGDDKTKKPYNKIKIELSFLNFFLVFFFFWHLFPTNVIRSVFLRSHNRFVLSILPIDVPESRINAETVFQCQTIFVEQFFFSLNYKMRCAHAFGETVYCVNAINEEFITIFNMICFVRTIVAIRQHVDSVAASHRRYISSDVLPSNVIYVLLTIENQNKIQSSINKRR